MSKIKLFIITLLISGLSFSALAKVTYLDRDWAPVKQKAKAVFYLAEPIKDQQKELWRLKIYFIKNKQLRFTTLATKPRLKKSTPIGPYTYYFDDGTIQGTGVNNKDGEYIGKLKIYFKSGKPRSIRSYKDGKLDGPYKDFYRNGQIHNQQNYKDGTEDGQQKSFYKDGKLKSTSLYKDGKEEGQWKSYYSTGKIRFVRNYKDGEYDGLKSYYHKNGVLSYQYVYKDGKPLSYHEYTRGGLLERKRTYNKLGKELTVTQYREGRAQFPYLFKDSIPYRKVQYTYYTPKLYKYVTTTFYPGTQIIKHIYTMDLKTKVHVRKTYDRQGKLTGYKRRVDGKADGRYFYNPRGKYYVEGRYKAGEKIGLWINKYGQRTTEIHYENGERHGSYHRYKANNDYDERGTYSYGQKVGTWTEINKRRSITTNYKKGKRDGWSKVSNAQGTLIREEHYKNGQLDGLSKTYFDDGTVKRLGHYSKGERDGLWEIRYSQNGSLYKGRYHQGKRTGEWKSYLSSGELRIKKHYNKHGKLDGDYIYYNKEGQVVRKSVYKNGHRVSS